MMNTGKVTLCDVKLKAVTGSDQVYSFWPDWAENASYEVYFNPQQMTAVGMTALPSEKTPYVEVASFRDCSAPVKAATEPLSSFTTVPIENVQPPAAVEELVTIPGATATPSGKKNENQKRRTLAQDEIPEGKCALYTIGKGTLALCVESIIKWGTDSTQVCIYTHSHTHRNYFCEMCSAVYTFQRTGECLPGKHQ